MFLKFLPKGLFALSAYSFSPSKNDSKKDEDIFCSVVVSCIRIKSILINTEPIIFMIKLTSLSRSIHFNILSKVTQF